MSGPVADSPQRQSIESLPANVLAFALPAGRANRQNASRDCSSPHLIKPSPHCIEQLRCVCPSFVLATCALCGQYDSILLMCDEVCPNHRGPLLKQTICL